MEEIYWLTRLEGIRTLAVILLALAVIVFVIWMISYFATLDGFSSSDHEKVKAIGKKYAWKFFAVVFFSFAVTTFVPEKREMLLIYGVGGTIDYIKSNDQAKQLPDKLIKKIDKLLEIEDDNEEEK